MARTRKDITPAVAALSPALAWGTMKDVASGLAQASRKREECFTPILRQMAAQGMTAQQLAENIRAACPDVLKAWPVSEKTGLPVGLGHADLRSALPAFNCFLTYLYGFERDDKGVPLVDATGAPRPKAKGKGTAKGTTKDTAKATAKATDKATDKATAYNRTTAPEKALLLALVSRLDAKRVDLKGKPLEDLEAAIDAAVELLEFLGLGRELPF